MKLGDTMAPIEACNVWNDVCPRKSRPPKIGDIPRHVAVDEESPGCSTSRSLVQVQESVAKKSILERSTVSALEHGKTVASGVLPPLETFMKPLSEPSKKVEQEVARIPGELEFERAEILKLSSIPSFPFGKTLNGLCQPIFKEISVASMPENLIEKLEHPRKNSSLQVLKSIGETDVTYHENESPEEIVQVRKDSALYIDAKKIETVDTTALAGITRSTGIAHQLNLDEVLKLSGPRARRESSGYFSNLGTFDDDRWGGTSDLVSQQDTAFLTRESLRERRRSSTKTRLPMGGGQQINRMTTIVYPAGEETVYSPSENDVAAFSTKTGRVEMPNIDEQSSLELNKSIDHSAEFAEIESELENKMSRISFDTSPVVSQSQVSKDIETGINFDVLGQQRSANHRAANRQRNRMVVHQYSSPNITNMELERIVEKPNSEKNLGSSRSEYERVKTAENVRDIEDPIGDFEEDDNEKVVTANLVGMTGRKRDDQADERKLFPRSIKVYQLLSTQSEDRGDGDARLFDRRISLQIPRNEEESNRSNTCGTPLPIVCTPLGSDYAEEKKLVHADSVPIFKVPNSDSTGVENELRLCAGGRIPGCENPSGPTIPGIRPIYPYYPYSPYASPQGSPRINRRRPLRESRRVSIDSRQGALQLNQYKLLNNIGQGSFGIVKLAYNEEDDTHYAMKILSKKKLMKKAGIFGRIAPGRKGVTNPLAKVYREIALLKKLDHPNVVKLVEVLDDPDEDNLYLVFELVQKGEVLQLPTDKPLDQETARGHFRDVVMGVEYLHYQRIVHRDIKPSNLLVDSEGRVKVADLGVSAELRAAGELLSGSAGTPAFAAPETTTPGAQYSGTLCDVWSMGVTLYSLVTGKVPWDGAGSIIGVQSAVRSEPLRFPESPCLTEDLRDLVSRMLSKDPSRRITLAEIKEHSWLTNNGNEPLPNEADNCRLPVTVTDEEVARVVTRVPKLDTLILIKTMLKQHSFQNPFLPRRIVRPGCTSSDAGSSGTRCLKQQVSSDTTDSSTELLPTVKTLNSKTEQFHKAGRSNSAPDSYEWQMNGRQISSDSLLPPLTEISSQEQQAELEKR